MKLGKKDKDFLKTIALLGAPLSFLPLFKEPFFHQTKINFWEWVYRELYEVWYGEQAKANFLRTLDIYSYTPLLLKYLRLKQPTKVLEWGPGVSTRIMATEAPDAEIYTIEHDVQWFEKLQDLQSNPKVHLFCIPLESDAYLIFPSSLQTKFDLIFIDGEAAWLGNVCFRELCLIESLSLLENDGIIVIHDSDTDWYGDTRFRFNVIEEADRTAVLQFLPCLKDMGILGGFE